MLTAELGEKYGERHEYYNLHTPADAIKLLCINYPALKKELMEAFLRAEGLLLKPTTPAQKVAIHIVPSRNAFFFSSTLTIPLAQLSISATR